MWLARRHGAREPRRQALDEAPPVALVDGAGPFVHERLLELDGERAAAVAVPLVHPPAELAATEADVLADVQRCTGDFVGRDVGHEAVDDAAPDLAVQAAGPDVDVRVPVGGGRWCIGAVSTVVVGVEVEEDEGSACRDVVEPVRQLGVELVVRGQ